MRKLYVKSGLRRHATPSRALAMLALLGLGGCSQPLEQRLLCDAITREAYVAHIPNGGLGNVTRITRIEGADAMCKAPPQ